MGPRERELTLSYYCHAKGRNAHRTLKNATSLPGVLMILRLKLRISVTHIHGGVHLGRMMDLLVFVDAVTFRVALVHPMIDLTNQTLSTLSHPLPSSTPHMTPQAMYHSHPSLPVNCPKRRLAPLLAPQSFPALDERRCPITPLPSLRRGREVRPSLIVMEHECFLHHARWTKF
jgi:hypothetical protein